MTLSDLIQIATGEGEVMEMARTMIGHAELALLIANAAVENTSIKLRPCNVSKATGLGADAAKDRIDNTALKRASGR